VFPVLGWHEIDGHFQDGAGRVKQVTRVIQRAGWTNNRVFEELAERIKKFNTQYPTSNTQHSSQEKVEHRTFNIERPASNEENARRNGPGFGKVWLAIRSSWFHVEGWNTTCQERLRRLQNFDGLLMNPLDGARFDISDGDTVRIISAHGTVNARAVFDGRVNRGWVLLSNAMPRTFANILWPAGGAMSEPIEVKLVGARKEEQVQPSLDQLRCLRFHR